MSKYGNHKIKNAYGTFDSIKEWERFLFLFHRQKEGTISNLRRQVEYELIPTQKGTKIEHLKTKDKVVEYVIERAVHYIADFVYERNGKTVVEDCKGGDSGYFRRGKGKTFTTATPDFKIKKKLMLWVHGIQVQIVTCATHWENDIP